MKPPFTCLDTWAVYYSFIATGTNFADALTGSVLAAKIGAPIVLTPPTGLSLDVFSEFSSHRVIFHTILGGKSAVNEQVEQDLWDVIKSITTH